MEKVDKRKGYKDHSNDILATFLLFFGLPHCTLHNSPSKLEIFGSLGIYVVDTTTI
jgi:hypothetical protein